MAKIKNVSGEDRYVPALGGRLVLAGAVLDVPAEDVYGFTCQTALWAPVDKTAQHHHDTDQKAEAERVGIINEPTEAPDPTEG